METKLASISDLPVTTGLPGIPQADARLNGKHEVRLAKAVGITQFGINLVTLDPGGMSSSRHWHMAEDEFLYVLAGTPTLVDGNGHPILGAGDIAGVPAGQPHAPPVVGEAPAPAPACPRCPDAGQRHRGRPQMMMTSAQAQLC